MKAGLLPYWDVDPEALAGALSDTPKLGFEFTFKNQDRTIDATIITEKGTSRFDGFEMISDPLFLFRGKGYFKNCAKRAHQH